MKRFPSGRGHKKQFHKTAKHVNPRNQLHGVPMRGGIRF